MKASVIVPTYERSNFLPNLIKIFKNQTYEDKELLILDDSQNEAKDIIALVESEQNIKYMHIQSKLTIGEKRNILLEQASGDIIVNFDDDDYYAPIYIEQMIKNLGEGDFVTLGSWFGYGINQNFFGYWHTYDDKGFNFNICPNTNYEITRVNHDWLDSFIWGYSFSYVFRKEIFTGTPGRNKVIFDNMNWGEDYNFVKKVRKEGYKMKELPDKTGLCIHIIHSKNASRMFPNYKIPEFLLTAIFGEDVLNYGYFKPFLF